MAANTIKMQLIQYEYDKIILSKIAVFSTQRRCILTTFGLLIFTGLVPLFMYANLSKTDASVLKRGLIQTSSEGNFEEARAARLKHETMRLNMVNERERIRQAYKDQNLDDDILEEVIVHEGNVDSLERTLRDIVNNSRPFNIGIVGGSISAGGGLSCKECIYAHKLGKSLERILGSPVNVYNGAVGATDSQYYAYCLEAHLDAKNMDLLLWELAANDFNKGLGPSSQEDLTRTILSLPNQPQLMFINFIFGRQMREGSCANSEDTGGKELNSHYGVPSLSMKGAVCDQVKNGEVYDYIAYDQNHPSSLIHTMMELFIRDFLLDILEDILEIDENDQLTKLPATPLPQPLFDHSALTHAQCWSSLLPQHGTGKYLLPMTSEGWRAVALTGALNMNRTDSKKCWITSKQGSVIIFPLDIEPYKDLTSTVALTTLTCDECGTVIVYIDNNIKNSILVHSKFSAKVTHTHIISNSINAGNHNITVVALSDNFFQLAAIMTAYNTTF
ncbi:uncharacterized protein LOC144351897 [Saccoglossus kowalevskii]